MIEMNTADENGGSVPLNEVEDLIADESRSKRKKMYIIIGVAVALVIILVVVLCVCLIKKKRIYNNNITLSVYSDSDDKEISFFSTDFNVNESFIKNENITMLIDGSKYNFSKSMKLKKGEHKIIISFDNIVESCSNMFKNCTDITEINFNMMDDCNNTYYMFSGCSSLKNLNFLNINTSKAKNMERMFNGCKNLNSLDLHNLDTTYVTNMEEMFNECNSIKEIKFNEKTNYKLEYGKFIPFDTYNVINMYHIFYGCNSLKSIDVSNFVLYKLKNNINDLFGDLEKSVYLKEIYNNLTKIKKEEKIIKDIDSNIVMEINIKPKREGYNQIFGGYFKDYQISESKMFLNNSELNFSKYIDLIYNEENTIIIYLEGNLEDASYMFERCDNMKIKFYKNFNDTRRKIFDKSNIKNMSFMFHESNNIEIDLSLFNSKNVEDMTSMFAYSSGLKINPNVMDSEILNLFFLNTSSVINMSSMFRKANFTNIYLSTFNTKSVRDMSYMFSFCKNLFSLDLSRFNMEKVLNISYMFYASHLRYINLWKPGINLIKDMSYVFSQSHIVNLDLSTVNTTGVEDMTEMFYNIEASSIKFGNFDTSKVTSMKRMFTSCYN